MQAHETIDHMYHLRPEGTPFENAPANTGESRPQLQDIDMLRGSGPSPPHDRAPPPQLSPESWPSTCGSEEYVLGRRLQHDVLPLEADQIQELLHKGLLPGWASHASSPIA